MTNERRVDNGSEAEPGRLGDTERLTRLRAEFPIVGQRTYLFSGGLAPASRRGLEAITRWMERWSRDPAAAWEDRFVALEAVRERLASLLGVTTDAVALTDNTSRASNVAISLLEPRPSANVVVDATTYPSSLLPWLPPVRHGIEVRRARIEPTLAGGTMPLVTAFSPLVDDDTLAISVSHVDPGSGFRHDLRSLADLAHGRGAVLIADMAQSAGVVPMDLTSEGVDLATGTAMKWLLGPPGIGYLVVSPALLARSGAPQVGYVGAQLDPADSARVRFEPSARRHELGLPDLLGMPGFAAGLELIAEARPDAVATHVEGLVSHCLRGLEARRLRFSTPIDPARRAGLVALPVREARRVQETLRRADVDVWASERRGIIRIDPHFFNDKEDIDRVLAILDDYRDRYGRDSLQAARTDARPPIA